jgi:D-xylose 1-dehydrogenase (NADP+, D-xylono-1,5-lactone-forming)
MTTHSQTRWGFIGAGNLATKATAKSVHNGMDMILYAAAARDVKRAEKILPSVAYSSYQDLVDDPKVDAVYISLNNDAHFPWIEKSLRAGKHVLCEKPLTMSAADTQRAYQMATDMNLLLVEATWALWSPRMQRVAQLVREGAIGAPENYLATFTFEGVSANNYRLKPAQGGGALFDVGIYPLHGLIALLPENTDYTVTEAVIDNAGHQVDMTTKARLTWQTPDDHQGRAGIVASFNMHPSQRFVLKGDSGEITISDDQAFTLFNKPGTLTVNGNTEEFSAVDPYQIMFEQVSRKIRGEEAWIPQQWQSIRVAELVDRIHSQG